jgi:hypothetical protein
MGAGGDASLPTFHMGDRQTRAIGWSEKNKVALAKFNSVQKMRPMMLGKLEKYFLFPSIFLPPIEVEKCKINDALGWSEYVSKKFFPNFILQ